ncbi:ABC transporter substrate-binding protein [Pseudodesulfovibrio sp.]|uniref:substrate-binding periplasmic protein n=1 Tax=Pseudodesulfovibrio sp. TaxID=2035812 RepID=UPI0026313D89|nr:ABC transporter substrate-binding protein [Pseudodesulfovibrio sp.]MDD3312745.1 ABC transporter substrate-binding protein [Pseudodesulfovibrio sp.]
MFAVMVLAAVLLALPSPVRSEEPPLRIDFPEFWPFFATRGDRVEGFFHDIVTEALARMGIRAAWAPFPWPRCQERVKTGQADAMITSPTPERLLYASTHADPFYEKKLQVFTYAGHPRLQQIKSIRSIDDIRRGGFVVVTYSGNGWNDTNIRSRGIKTYETPRLKNVWGMLANRRGDIVIEWPGGAWPDIVETGREKYIVQTNVTLQTMPFHLLIRNGSPYAARLPEFNRVILAMKRDGSLDRIVDKYIKQYQANPNLPPLSEPNERREHVLATLLAH